MRARMKNKSGCGWKNFVAAIMREILLVTSCSFLMLSSFSFSSGVFSSGWPDFSSWNMKYQATKPHKTKQNKTININHIINREMQAIFNSKIHTDDHSKLRAEEKRPPTESAEESQSNKNKNKNKTKTKTPTSTFRIKPIKPKQPKHKYH